MKRFSAAVLLVSGVARAHDADIIYVLADAREAQVIETLTLTASTLGQLAPVDADHDGELSQRDLDARTDALRAGVWDQLPLTAAATPCTRAPTETARLREGFIELRAEYACGPGELRQNYKILSVLPANYRVVLGSQSDAELSHSFAQGTLTHLTVPRVTAASGPRVGSLFQEGFARCFTLDVLGCVVLLLISVTSWRAAAGLGVVLLGSLISVPAMVGPLVLGLAALGCVVPRASRRVDLIALLVGLGVGVHGGGAGLSLDTLALFAGTVLGLALVCTPAALVGRMLRRRPAWLFRAQLGLMVAVLFSVAFQLV